MSGELDLHELAGRLTRVSGVVGVVLGGSRARGEHSADSDYDLGLYYRPPLDTSALGALAREFAGPEAVVSEPGDWGPWVDGGAWLTIDGHAVDWIYRDADRAHRSWADAQDGRCRFHAQVGHPFGVPDFAYAGELALGVVLDDPTGELTALHEAAQTYPPALSIALADALWEADFLLGVLRKSLARADPAWVAGCLFRIVMLCVHALHGAAGRWLINEKGALASTAKLAVTPAGFAERAGALCGLVGSTPSELDHTVDGAAALIDLTRSAVGPSAGSG